MKNIWKIALCFCFGLMTLTSCEEIEKIFDDETETESVNPIVGVWTCGTTGTSTYSKFSFNNDGSGSWKTVFGTDKFTWEATNNELYLNYDNSYKEATYFYKIEDNNTHLYLYENASDKYPSYSCTRKQ